MARKSLKVLVFPRDWNPYQELLYRPMWLNSTDPVAVAYSTRNHVVWPVVVPLGWLVRRAMGYRVLHVHWMTLQFKAPVPFRKPLSYWMYRAMFSLARRIGLTIVWTVHNVLPHEPQTTDDRDIAGRLSRQAAAKIVHSSHAIGQMRDQGLDTNDVTVIPHGNYIGVYPAEISRDAARARFGLTQDDQVVLFFGNMRAYKGVDELRAVWPGLEGPGRKLILAGDCPDPDLRARLDILARTSSVQVVYDRVPDADVAAYLLAADIVCAPFKAVTTSGSVLLALTFGRPVVAPRAGALIDLPPEVGFFYEPSEPDGLARALARAMNDDNLAGYQAAALAYAESISWEAAAARTVEVYREALRSGR